MKGLTFNSSPPHSARGRKVWLNDFQALRDSDVLKWGYPQTSCKFRSQKRHTQPLWCSSNKNSFWERFMCINKSQTFIARTCMDFFVVYFFIIPLKRLPRMHLFYCFLKFFDSVLIFIRRSTYLIVLGECMHLPSDLHPYSLICTWKG